MFHNTTWAQGLKNYPWASLFLSYPRDLVTFMIMSRRNNLLFFGHIVWRYIEISCFQVLKHSPLMPWIQRALICKNQTSISKIICKNWLGTVFWKGGNLECPSPIKEAFSLQQEYLDIWNRFFLHCYHIQFT